jgi:hypothetical protein
MILGHLWKYYSEEEYSIQPQSRLNIWFSIHWKIRLKNIKFCDKI